MSHPAQCTVCALRGSGSRPTGRASKAVSPVPASIPNAPWHLICVTHKGKVTMLRDLDLHTARETYKRLMPGTYPVNYIDPGCAKCGGNGGGCFSSFGRSYGPHDDWLDKVEIVGPAGAQLDPWHGVKPQDRYLYHCRCPKAPPPPPEWDSRRADFWNNPKLWEGIDPTKQMCWQESPDEHLHSDGPRGVGVKRRQRDTSDLRRAHDSKGRAHKQRDRKPAPRPAVTKAALRSERAGA